MQKKRYEQPKIEVTEFRFSEHIATSTECYWGGGAQWTHRLEGCEKNYNPNPGGWIGLNG